MEVIVAAALIAIAVVVAAVMYGRTHTPVPVAPPAPDNSATATALQAALAGAPDAIADDRCGGELARALELLGRRFPEPPRERRDRDRALGMLLRKGYEHELAVDAVNAHARAQ